MSVAFVKEESAETASETLLPDRPVSPHPNLVTEAGLKALEMQLQEARAAYDAAGAIEGWLAFETVTTFFGAGSGASSGRPESSPPPPLPLAETSVTVVCNCK